MKKRHHIFTADIGATNSRFCLFQADLDASGSVTLKQLHQRWLQGADYPSFMDALEFLLTSDDGFVPDEMKVDQAVLALAGPVVDGVCKISNLPWVVKAVEVGKRLGCRETTLINDFTAQGCACLVPEGNSLFTIQKGQAASRSPLAVIGAGTGLGKAFIVPPLEGADVSRASGTRTAAALAGNNAPPVRKYSAKKLKIAARSSLMPSEGGHADFPFVGPEENEFCEFIRAQTGRDRVIGDMVITGSGLGHLYAFLTGERVPDKEASKLLPGQPKVLEWYARLYGRACRNFVLETLALRGIYVTGGMAMRVPVLEHPAFLEEFHLSAAHDSLLRKTPVMHLHSHETGLWGAALYAVLKGLERSEKTVSKEASGEGTGKATRKKPLRVTVS